MSVIKKLLLLIIFVPTLAHAATFYISNSTGNDLNSGNLPTTPWKTINKVRNATVTPGTTFCFYGGDTWTSTGTSGTASAELDINNSQGTVNARVYYGTCAGFGPNLPATLDEAGLTQYGIISVSFNGQFAKYVTVSGFKVLHATAMGISFRPNGGDMPGIIIQNNEVSNSGAGCYSTNGACTAGFDDLHYYNQIELAEDGFVLGGTYDAVIIQNNIVHDVGGHNCFQVHGDIGAGIIQGNIAGPNCEHSGIDFKMVGSSGHVFTVSGNYIRNANYYTENQGNPNENILFTGNYGTTNGIGFQNCPGLVNSGFTAGGTIDIWNNTIWETKSANGLPTFLLDKLACNGANVGTQNTYNLDFRNNILDGGPTNASTLDMLNGGEAYSPCVEDYNNIGGYQGYTGFFSCGGRTSLATHDYGNVDPLYVGPLPPTSPANLALNPGSPMINAGDPTLFTITNTANIGAYFTTSPPSSPSPTPTPTATPSTSPTPTPSPTPSPQVDNTFRNLRNFGALGLTGRSGTGDFITGVNLNHWVSPLAYGAKCDASCSSFGEPNTCTGTDDTTAFTNAMAKVNQFKWILKIPASFCIVNATLTLSAEGAGIDGHGDKVSTIVATVAGFPQIHVTAKNWQLSNFHLTRVGSVPSTVGSDNIDVDDGMAGPVMDHIFTTHGYVGFNLGGASYGRMTKIQTYGNVSDGIRMTAGGKQALQWVIDDVLSELNGGSGFHVIGGGGGINNLGPWHQPYTYNNGGYGIEIRGGSVNTGLYDGQISDWTSSGDCEGAILLDSYGKNWNISGGYEEFAGQSGLSVPCTAAGSGLGHGIVISSNYNGASTVENNQLQQNAGAGIYDQTADSVSYSNNFMRLNGFHGYLLTGNGTKNILGGTSNSNTGYGVAITGSSLVYGVGVVCQNNSSGPHSAITGSNWFPSGGSC